MQQEHQHELHQQAQAPADQLQLQQQQQQQQPVEQVRPFSPGGRPLKCYVGNLSSQCRMFHLREKFSPYGTITNVELKPNIGCGFVEFTTADSCAAACRALDGTELFNQTLRVEAQKQNSGQRKVVTEKLEGCFNCGSKTHWAKHCPNMPAAGTPQNVLPGDGTRPPGSAGSAHGYAAAPPSNDAYAHRSRYEYADPYYQQPPPRDPYVREAYPRDPYARDPYAYAPYDPYYGPRDPYVREPDPYYRDPRDYYPPARDSYAREYREPSRPTEYYDPRDIRPVEDHRPQYRPSSGREPSPEPRGRAPSERPPLSASGGKDENPPPANYRFEGEFEAGRAPINSPGEQRRVARSPPRVDPRRYAEDYYDARLPPSAGYPVGNDPYERERPSSRYAEDPYYNPPYQPRYAEYDRGAAPPLPAQIAAPRGRSRSPGHRGYPAAAAPEGRYREPVRYVPNEARAGYSAANYDFAPTNGFQDPYVRNQRSEEYPPRPEDPRDPRERPQYGMDRAAHPQN